MLGGLGPGGIPMPGVMGPGAPKAGGPICRGQYSWPSLGLSEQHSLQGANLQSSRLAAVCVRQCWPEQQILDKRGQYEQVSTRLTCSRSSSTAELQDLNNKEQPCDTEQQE